MGTLSQTFALKMQKIIILATFILATISNSLAGDLIEAAIEDGKLETVVKAVTDVGLVRRFKTVQAVTIFAPSDEAFEQLDIESWGRRKKVATLSRHTIIGSTFKVEDIPIGPLQTLGRNEINVSKTQDGKVQIKYNGKTATVIQPDIIASNGVIHIIDKVLL